MPRWFCFSQRTGEALAIKWMDFRNNVLHVTRRIYDGDVDAMKSKRSERKLPTDPVLTIPDDQQLASQMAQQVAEELDHLRAANPAGTEAKIEIPPGLAGLRSHRSRPPTDAGMRLLAAGGAVSSVTILCGLNSEWKGAARRTKLLVACTLTVLGGSTIIVGYGDYIGTRQ